MLPMETQAANPNKQDLHVSEMDAEDVKKKKIFSCLRTPEYSTSHLHKYNLKSSINI